MPHRLGPMQTLPASKRKFADSETVDYCIVGVGSAGGALVQRLARAGFRVVALEAGPFWDTEKDWVSDEKGSHELYWNDLRITGGSIRSRRCEQQRQRRGRRHRPLGRVCASISSVGLSRGTRKMASASTGQYPMGI